jgi:predicted nucleic acid-binding protein
VKPLSWCYHLDTNYLISYLQSSYTHSDEARHASQSIEHLLYNGYLIEVSEVVVGEFMKVLVDKKGELGTSPTNLLSELYTFCTHSGVELYRLDAKRLGRFTDLVNRIKKKERYIEATDVLIVAYSIVDRRCKGLLTFDQNLINSRSLKELIDECAQDRKGYTITDQPPSRV